MLRLLQMWITAEGTLDWLHAHAHLRKDGQEVKEARQGSLLAILADVLHQPSQASTGCPLGCWHMGDQGCHCQAQLSPDWL